MEMTGNHSSNKGPNVVQQGGIKPDFNQSAKMGKQKINELNRPATVDGLLKTDGVLIYVWLFISSNSYLTYPLHSQGLNSIR